MIKFVLFILILFKDDISLEKKAFLTKEACRKAGEARIAELQLDPKVDDVLMGGCVDIPVVEAKK